jgi:response regulator of citrate/malate metabolism
MLDAPPDLVLVDLRLPDGHGLELLEGGIPRRTPSSWW